jgi:hypothetical protein
LPKGAKVEWSSDHLGLTMPFNHGVDIDLIVDVHDGDDPLRYDAFLNVQEKPVSAAHSLNLTDNIFAPFNTNYYFTLNDKDELVDFYLLDASGSKQLILPSGINHLKYEAEHLEKVSKTNGDKTYRRPVYTPKHISILVAQWIFTNTGRDDLEVCWNSHAEMSLMMKEVSKRLKETDLGREKIEPVKLDEDLKVSPETMDFLLSLGMEKAGEVMREHRKMLVENAQPVKHKS